MTETGTVPLELAYEAVRSVLPPRRLSKLELGPDTRIEELGVASMQLAEMIVFLEERLGSPVDVEALKTVETLGDLTRLRVVQ